MNFEYMNAIMDFLKKELKDVPNENWLSFSHDLKKLVDEISIYNDNKEANKEALNNINMLFKNAITSADKYLKTPFNENNPSEAIRHNMTKKLNDKFLSKLYVDFSNIDSNKNIKEALDKFRITPIKVTNDEIKDVGGNLSVRTKLTLDIDGKKVTGFFTPTKTFDSIRDFKIILDDIIKKYPRYKEYFSKLNTSEGIHRYTGITLSEVLDNTGMINSQFLTHLGDFGYLPKNLTEIYNKFKNDSDFLAANLELIKKSSRFSIGHSINTEVLELKPGDNIDKRNSAMSGIAHLLECDNVVAKSRPITIERVIDGKSVFFEGTFMEQAKGKDLSTLPIDDEVYDMNSKNINSGLGKKALADLQIIDYICGNVDRHSGNLFYQFDPKTKKLIGVEGIDNDTTFFKNNPKLGDYKHLFVEIPKMVVIDAEMAYKVSLLEEAPFKATLIGYGLTNKEINAAWERTKKLQNVIENSVIYEKGNDVIPDEIGLTIVSSSDWDDVKLENLTNLNGTNIFKRVTTQFNNLSGKMVENKEIIFDTSVKLYAYKSKLGYAKNYLNIARHNSNLFGTSKRYKNIIKALEETSSEANLEKKFNKLNKLQKAIDVYKTEKNRDGILDDKGNLTAVVTGKALNRINLVNDLEEYIKIAKEIRKDYLYSCEEKIKDEKTVDEYNAIHRKGKYENYPKAIKNEDNKIIINSDIYNRDEQFKDVMKTLNEQLESKAVDGYRTNNEKLVNEANNIDKVINKEIKNIKDILTDEYHHGLIPKEYFDARVNQLDNRLFNENLNDSFISNNPLEKANIELHNNLKNDLNEDVINDEIKVDNNDIDVNLEK